VRLAGPEAAALIEAVASYAPDARDARDAPQPRNLRESVRLSAEGRARTCYDHLAGQLGVALADAMIARGLVAADSGLAVTAEGRAWLGDTLGYERPPGSRRPLVRACLDWTERRPHLAGALGAALCAAALDRGWVRRVGSGRAVKVTPQGAEAFRKQLGAEV
ncbi:transcriptional regulator, partial [Streptomyces phytophilus]|uniref:transcriptional regulator n=1 Tax=Streptomyces phytophilus TaxID=722715 RepID=UPI0015EFF042